MRRNHSMSTIKQADQIARAAGMFNDSFEPYFAQSYEQPEQVKKMYKALDVQFETPAFMKDDRSFTTQEEMMAFLYDLSATCDFVDLEIIGHSLEGREIPMLTFSMSAEGSKSFQAKPTVWLQAQVHGNEPAAGESALVIAKQLANGTLTDVLEHVNVVIVPRMNPDSGYYFERNAATNLNGNRDHMNLEMVELQAIHQAFKRFTPEVVIDAHEYGAQPTYNEKGEEGALKSQDVLLLSGKNLNIPAPIREKADEWFVNIPFEALKEKGYSYGNYYLVTEPNADTPVLAEGGTDAGTGRNAFALKPSFCILVETLGIGIGRGNFLRRVDGQVVTHSSIIRTTAEKAAEVKSVIADARDSIVQGAQKGKDNDPVVIKSERTEENGHTIEAIDIAKGELIEFDVAYHSATNAVPTFERTRPTAYILPPAFHDIAEKLEMLGAEVDQLSTGIELDVECFEVVERDVSNKGDRPLSIYKTSIDEKKRFFQKGSYVIIGAQPAAHIVSLALEPESIDSYFTYNFVPTYVEGELPVYRYMKEDISFLEE